MAIAAPERPAIRLWLSLVGIPTVSYTHLTDDLILEKLAMAKNLGIDRVKLYFMIGLPGESDEHVAAMTGLCRRIIAETGQSLTLSRCV